MSQATSIYVIPLFWNSKPYFTGNQLQNLSKSRALRVNDFYKVSLFKVLVFTRYLMAKLDVTVVVLSFECSILIITIYTTYISKRFLRNFYTVKKIEYCSIKLYIFFIQ
ncbi:hypothetical protein BDC45DRAFT_530486 [Circinella umbellata]|nr:hypothetical protein BDC45DRAFT_530486 [Circinella umbellata]